MAESEGVTVKEIGKISGHDASRIAGKEARRELTDALLEFSTYVDETGDYSKSGRKGYIGYTNMVNAALGLTKKQLEAARNGIATRDTLHTGTLGALLFLENGLSEVFRKGMREKKERARIKDEARMFAARMGEMFGEFVALIEGL